MSYLQRQALGATQDPRLPTGFKCPDNMPIYDAANARCVSKGGESSTTQLVPTESWTSKFFSGFLQSMIPQAPASPGVPVAAPQPFYKNPTFLVGAAGLGVLALVLLRK